SGGDKSSGGEVSNPSATSNESNLGDSNNTGGMTGDQNSSTDLDRNGVQDDSTRNTSENDDTLGTNNQIENESNSENGTFAGYEIPEDAPQIDLPDVDDQTIAKSSDRVSRSSNPKDAVDLDPFIKLRGTWKQINPLQNNRDDFAPGGYSDRVIGIDTKHNQMHVFVGFGTPRTVAAGVFRLFLDLNGTITISHSDSGSSRFPMYDIKLNNGIVIIAPEQKKSFEYQWKLIGGDTPELIIDDKRYVRVDYSEYESMRSPDIPVVIEDNRIIEDTDDISIGIESDEQRETTSIDFFGLKANARYVCYIVDVSSSMSGNNIIKVKQELAKSLKNLPKETHFYVLLFSNDAGKIAGWDHWTKATENNVSRFINLLSSLGTGGGTNPRPAFELVFSTTLRPNPDTIYFLTDGGFSSGVVNEINGWNAQRNARILIHSIAIGASADVQTLRRLATDNGGQMKHLQ
ncbi:VWA domain-containing protein, partial [PVC group bacterium]|nr:VWA domain-containing protein [PVC group bacterium]